MYDRHIFHVSYIDSEIRSSSVTVYVGDDAEEAIKEANKHSNIDNFVTIDIWYAGTRLEGKCVVLPEMNVWCMTPVRTSLADIHEVIAGNEGYANAKYKSFDKLIILYKDTDKLTLREL